MTSLVAPLEFQEKITLKTIRRSRSTFNNNNRYPRHVLKSRCLFKGKCDKVLKRKLRKYKLRKNADEDQDVVDVSHIFLSTLRIKSPNKLHRSPGDSNNIKPRNYLFKMARRKPKIKPENTDGVTKNDKDSATISPTLESQEKKQTNAFQLMMNSRNKSIGSNSPGKEIDIDASEVEEKIEKKFVKAKRNLALQKMAEAKGSLKNQEIKELEEVCIKQKMEKRKDRLKNMIVQNTKKPKEKKIDRKASKSSDNILVEVVQIVEDSSDYNNEIEKKPNQLKLVDIFQDVIKPSAKVSPDKKILPKEDEEFLNKLSPSIKKKENMLSYFKKIEKKSESSLDGDAENDVDNINSSPVIKVKVSQRSKKKIKKKKLSLNKETIDPTVILKDHNENNSHHGKEGKVNSTSDNLTNGKIIEKERKKRKHAENFTENRIEACENANKMEPAVDTVRPKRNIKKPVKYTDDIQLSSSDEELHVFTPKKRKQSAPKVRSDEAIVLDTEAENKDCSKVKKVKEKENKVQKKPSKLAPIFAPKPLLNPEQIEAKQKFLYSGVPDQIKKIIAQQKTLNTEISNCFPVVVHVQQKDTTPGTLDISSNIFVPVFDFDKDILFKDMTYDYTNIVTTACTEKSILDLTPPSSNSTAVLQGIKEVYPKFPVYRTFRLLNNKSKGEFRESNTNDLENSVEVMDNIVEDFNENPDNLIWTDKFKASSTKNMIGNFDSIKELKKWLESWTENEARVKKTSNESDSSDFYDTDSNSRDCFKSVKNLLILTGPVGCGKTSSVYAVATELAMKVIEVNASSKRTGKVMLQDLQEATQSHKVNRVGSDNSQKSQELIEDQKVTSNKRKGRPKKIKEKVTESTKDEVSQSVSQDSTRTGMSLILVDDADIVFDQDDGFASAIAQLAQCSKRPVILVTGSLTCPHLQKFVLYGKVIKLNPLPPRMLGTWLDIMCVADNSACWPGLGAKILNYFKGDIRKSINCLQFYMTAYCQGSQGEKVDSQGSNNRHGPDDENSNMSWADSDAPYDSNAAQKVIDANNDIWKRLMNKHIDLLHLRYPMDLLNVWWSVPTLFGEAFDVPLEHSSAKPVNKLSKQTRELDAIANVIDNLSLSDYFSKKQPDTNCNITSQPWYSSQCDSVSELENFDNYTRYDEVTGEIIKELVNTSIAEAQGCIQCEKCTTIQFPGMAAQREKNRIISRHNNLTDILNASAALDRRALGLDYWSACRSICRIEKNRTDTGLKRNNRFCHYLKSLNVVGRNDSYDRLGDSLCHQGKE